MQGTTNITVKVKDPNEVVPGPGDDETPDSGDPEVPDTGDDTPVTPEDNETPAEAPNTGYFTSTTTGTNQNNTLGHSTIPLIGICSLLFFAFIIIATIIFKKKSKLSHSHAYSKHSFNPDSSSTYNALNLKHNKKAIFFFSLLAILFLSSFTISFKALLSNGNSKALEDDTSTGESLQISTTNIDLNVELEDKPVFATAKSTVTVNTPTDAGYTLMAYIEGETGDLVKTSNDTTESSTKADTNPNTISSIKALSSSSSQSLTDNTWGISLKQPESKDEAIFHGLPLGTDEPLTLNVKGTETNENDETDIYFSVYVTPDLDYGTYTGTTINYYAVSNITADDITVVYHGNGLYFDEDEEKDKNTVVYGNTCGLAYIGGNCKTAYTTEEPAEIVKTSNINNNGIQNGSYPQNGEEILSPITISGADAIRVEVKYGFAAGDGMAVIQGAWDGNGVPTNYEAIFSYNNESLSGEETFTIVGDTITFYVLTQGEPVVDYDYGFYAKIYPVYDEKPEDVETVETTICNIVKSDNVDDEGNKIESYAAMGNLAPQTITLPGADKVRVEITYGLTSEAGITIAEGEWGGWNNGDPEGRYHQLDAWEGNNISGTKSYTFDNDTITIQMGAWDDPIEGYDYGFFARVYPIYDELTMTCSPAVQRLGEYEEPIGFEAWYILENRDDENSRKWLFNRSDVEQYLVTSYDELKGKRVDIYALPILYMQRVSNWGDSVTEGQEVLVVDKRDNKLYTVARLADGNLWMTQNLDLNLDSTKTYTSEDTDLPDGTTWTPERSTYLSDDTSWDHLGNDEQTGRSLSYTHPESYDPGDVYWDGIMSNSFSEDNCEPEGGSWEVDAETGDGRCIINLMSSSGIPQYHLGNYYNWTAAIAMNDSSNFGIRNGQAGQYENLYTNQSICPAGWTLPGGEIDSETWDIVGNGSFDTLWRTYNAYSGIDPETGNPISDYTILINSPLYFIASGYFYGSLGDVGGHGFFWSSVAANEYSAGGAHFDVYGSVYPSGYGSRYGGHSVRCIARPVSGS